MKKTERDAILISFFEKKEKYKKLGEYIVNSIRNDPAAPKENLYTITYRIKDETRLIEKIDEENANRRNGTTTITENNFQTKIGDLIGIRLICYRLSDITKVETYLRLLVEDKVLRFIEGPKHKRSFVLPIDPGETVPKGLNLKYSGYSSIHYQVELGENSDATHDLKEIQVEIQLRTILEEAWGEIDHKYRYVLSRSRVELPEYIHTGFYNLSAYLQVAAMQAEYLCRQAEPYRVTEIQKMKKESHIAECDESLSAYAILDDTIQDESSTDLREILEEMFGFKPTARTAMYIKKRLDDFGHKEHPHIFFKNIAENKSLHEFRSIYREMFNRDAFKSSTERNIDLINAVNFALFNEVQGESVSREGLKAVLKWRNH